MVWLNMCKEFVASGLISIQSANAEWVLTGTRDRKTHFVHYVSQGIQVTFPDNIENHDACENENKRVFFQ